MLTRVYSTPQAYIGASSRTGKYVWISWYDLSSSLPPALRMAGWTYVVLACGFDLEQIDGQVHILSNGFEKYTRDIIGSEDHGWQRVDVCFPGRLASPIVSEVDADTVQVAHLETFLTLDSVGYMPGRFACSRVSPV